jgi:thiol:disulfide interchange protein DsbD
VKLFYLFLAFLVNSTCAQDALPPLEQVFSANAELIENNKVRIHLKMADNFFLFRDQLRISSDTLGIEIANAELPTGLIEHDDFFGNFATYRQILTFEMPFQRTQNTSNELALNILSHGCLYNVNNCYPPHLQKISLKLPQNSSPQNTEDFLDPEMAFLFDATLENPTTVKLTWQIADGYYLYKNKIYIDFPNMGEIQFPPAQMKQDANFGTTEVYYQKLELFVPLKQPLSSPTNLKVSYQGCAEKGLCYPPQIKEKMLSTTNKTDLLANLGKTNQPIVVENQNFLDPDEAFKLTAEWTEPNVVTVNWQIANNYYLYKNKLKFALKSGGQLGTIELPMGKPHEDEFSGKTEVYYQQLTAKLPLEKADKTLSLEITYQGCAEGALCYPPQIKSLTLIQNAPTTIISSENTQTLPQQQTEQQPLSETDEIAQTLAQNSVGWILLSFFGFGLLLALTPCVFPMIPILSGIIVGQKDITPQKAFVLSLIYVLSMALTYTIVGVIMGLVGENLQAMFQNVWVLVSFAAIFVLLSLSMFGFYELQMPTAIQNKLNHLSNRQSGGTLIGVAIMGFLSALIVGPCVAAPLAGALIFIGQTGNAFLGGAALFALSIGMGVPLIIIGTSAGKFLPKAGVWMENVKAVFGVLLLGVAVWMLERVLTVQISMVLYALLLIIPAVYMGAFQSLPAEVSGWRKLVKGISLIMAFYGALLIIGASLGGNSVFQPLKGVISCSEEMSEEFEFDQISHLEELKEALNDSKGELVMLDFYADWCISCKELEVYTFADQRVQTALEDMVTLQADVTANTEQDKALLKQFKLYGPPAILFFNQQGEELTQFRIVGFKTADQFLAHLEKIKKKDN